MKTGEIYDHLLSLGSKLLSPSTDGLGACGNWLGELRLRDSPKFHLKPYKHDADATLKAHPCGFRQNHLQRRENLTTPLDGIVDLWERIGITLACVTLPVLWGVIVNWLFNRWLGHRADKEIENESIYPDYQI